MCPLVDDGIFNANTLFNGGVSQDDGILDHGTLLDGYATANDGILNGSFNETAVTYKGIGDLGTFKVLCRAGVCGSCVDGPFCSEQVAGHIVVQKFKRSVEVIIQACQCSKVASVLIASYIKILALDIDDI